MAMGGVRITAVVLTWVALAIPGFADEKAPVVSIQQPDGIARQCECNACLIGVCCDKENAVLPASHTGPVVMLAGASCDIGPSCGLAAGCDDAATCTRLSACDSAGCDMLTPCDDCCTAAGDCDAPGCGSLGCDDLGCDAACSTGACNTACSSGCSDAIDWKCLDLCCRQGFWLKSDVLMWWTNDDNIPTLATSSPLGTPVDDAGVLGLPTTTTLFDGPLYGDMRPGGRIRFGWWSDECHHGIEGSVWGLRNDRNESIWSSAGDPAYARPFYNIDPLVDAEDAQLIGFDGVVQGSLQINTQSEIFGGDIGLKKNLICCSDFCNSTSTRLDAYLGYRYFKVREGVNISESLESTALTGPTVLGTTIDLFDDFQTRNEFHGANIGFVAMQQYGRWTTEVTSRLAIGNISREVAINGSTTVTVPSLPSVTRTGGLLAQSSNIGTYRDDEFAVLPELQINLGYNVNCNTKFIVGYNFMYLGELVRPGDIIDRTVNGLALDPTLPFAGPERPRFDFFDSRTWLMGINLGVAFNF